ncbi:MAG: AmpG family muropeptide MFS transporter [Pseudomonadota bacterium]
MLICVATGFASGLPLYLLIQLVPAWLRFEGVGLKEIGLFALIGFPYTWKFLWSPVLDRFTPPFLGRRRGWILITQLALAASMMAIGFVQPELSLRLIAFLAATIAFFSASQDIVLDAYRREILPDTELGLGNAVHVQAYRLAGLVPGSLGLILSDHLPWSSVFIVVAAFMLVGVVMTLLVAEPPRHPDAPKTFSAAVVEPFREFVNRAGLHHALLVLAFLFLYKLGDSMATALQTPFFVDVGFSATEIGTVAKFASLIAAITGGLLGGLVMVKMSINRALWLFGFVQIISILGFALLAIVGQNLWMLGAATAFEYLGVGLGSAAMVAFMARETSPAFAATQFALFSALAAVPRTLASAVTGFLVEQIGWVSFFILCTAMAVPGMLLLFKVAPWNSESSGG